MLSFSSMRAIKWESAINSYPVLHKSDSDHYLSLIKRFSCTYLLPEIFRGLLLISTKPYRQNQAYKFRWPAGNRQNTKPNLYSKLFLTHLLCNVQSVWQGKAQQILQLLHFTTKSPNQTQAHSICYCIPAISIFSCYAPFNNWAKKSIVFKTKFQQQWVQYDYSVVQCYITMSFKILH